MTGKGRTTLSVKAVDGPSTGQLYKAGNYLVDATRGHIVVWREDNMPVEGPQAWYDLWTIKNAVWGDGIVAVEIYPARSDLVDGQNQRHLWRVEEDMDAIRIAKEFSA